MNYLECILCGISGPQVRVRVVEWADDPKKYHARPACTDVRECRERVEQRQEQWPLRETPETRRANG
jgi:hypothetical protein